MWSETHPRWLLFAGEVVVSAQELEREYRMSVEVKGLADTVRRAKEAIRTASTAAERMNDSAQRVSATVAQVESMIVELDQANADLTAALGSMTNGGPPLDEPASSQGSSESGLTPSQAANVVAAQNKP
jgi:hypothetical protein